MVVSKTEINQKKIFCQFLDALVEGRCCSEDWQKNIITHYKDDVVESARRQVVKITHPDSNFENLFIKQIAEIEAVRRSLLPHEPSLTGILGGAFRISGRGTVLIVENYNGDMPLKGRLQVGGFSAKITGVEFPRKTIRRYDGSIELDKSMIGILIADDVKEQLLEMKGQPVEVFEL